MTDLTPKVRAEAAQAAEAVLAEWGFREDVVDSRMTAEMVDAVAAVVKAEHQRELLEDLEREQARSDKHLRIADKAVARFPPLVAERDQLQARVQQLTAAYTDLQTQLDPGSNARLRAEAAKAAAEPAPVRTVSDDRAALIQRVADRLQSTASSGDLNRYTIQDCADALYGHRGMPGSEFVELAPEVDSAALLARVAELEGALREIEESQKGLRIIVTDEDMAPHAHVSSGTRFLKALATARAALAARAEET